MNHNYKTATTEELKRLNDEQCQKVVSYIFKDRYCCFTEFLRNIRILQTIGYYSDSYVLFWVNENLCPDVEEAGIVSKRILDLIYLLEKQDMFK